MGLDGAEIRIYLFTDVSINVIQKVDVVETEIKNEVNEKYDVITTRRGRECAVHEGYRYYYKKISKNKNKFWRCVDQNKKCNGSMMTNDGKVVKVNKHKCLPKYIENEKLRILHRCVSETDPRGASATVLHKEIK